MGVSFIYGKTTTSNALHHNRIHHLYLTVYSWIYSIFQKRASYIIAEIR